MQTSGMNDLFRRETFADSANNKVKQKEEHLSYFDLDTPFKMSNVPQNIKAPDLFPGT